MSKKFKGKRAFDFFLLEWRDRQRAPYRNLQEIAADRKCIEAWKNLSPVEKRRLVALAKERKIQSQGNPNKLANTGEKLIDVQEEENQIKQAIEKMKQDISSVISEGLRHRNLQNLRFIFIHVNWFYQKQLPGINEIEYGPAEFALSQFSLNDGTENVYHEILRTSIPLLRYKRDALITSSETHKIPVDYENGEHDFSLMYSKLISFLETNMTGNRLPPLFTLRNCEPAVSSLLHMMCDTAKQDIDHFRIYSIEALFNAMLDVTSKHSGNKEPVSLLTGDEVFQTDVFAHDSGAECVFHKFIDNTSQYCSRSIVTRWGFNFCKYCCNYMNVNMVEGVHSPAPKKDYTNDMFDTHRERVSGRMYVEERRRREESKPLEIIDHGKFGFGDTSIPETDIERSPQNSVGSTKVKPISTPVPDLTKDFPPTEGVVRRKSLRPFRKRNYT